MKALDWFQARALAKLTKRPVRQEGWRKWLLYRNLVWLISEEVDGRETLRVPLNTDMEAAQYLAKDWTEEPWEGGTKPPCTNHAPADVLPGSDTGGAGTFTLTDFCGGAGQGGMPPPISGPGITEPPVSDVQFVLVANSVSSSSELSPVAPDGVGCWITPPTEFYLVLAAKVTTGTIVDARFQYSTSGADLSGELEFGESHPNADDQPAWPGGSAFDPSAFGEGWVAVWSIAAIPFVPGATITARLDLALAAGGFRQAFATLTHAADCP